MYRWIIALPWAHNHSCSGLFNTCHLNKCHLVIISVKKNTETKFDALIDGAYWKNLKLTILPPVDVNKLRRYSSVTPSLLNVSMTNELKKQTKNSGRNMQWLTDVRKMKCCTRWKNVLVILWAWFLLQFSRILHSELPLYEVP